MVHPNQRKRKSQNYFLKSRAQKTLKAMAHKWVPLDLLEQEGQSCMATKGKGKQRVAHRRGNSAGDFHLKGSSAGDFPPKGRRAEAGDHPQGVHLEEIMEVRKNLHLVTFLYFQKRKEN